MTTGAAARRNLVVVRAGDDSQHETWLSGGAARNWDLIISYYGDDPERFRAHCLFRVDLKGPKFPALAKLLREHAETVAAYDYVLLPDDDLVSDCGNINRFFDICRDHELDLAQPALSRDSHYSHPVTIGNGCFKLRYTNFVEIMTPCFSAAFLARCAPTFVENVSGWGLDHLWCRMARPEKVAIVDATPVRHTRPIGGPMHGFFAKMGIDPRAEERQIYARFGFWPGAGLATGGIDHDGKPYRTSDGSHGDFIIKLISGYARPETGPTFDYVTVLQNSLRHLPPVPEELLR